MNRNKSQFTLYMIFAILAIIINIIVQIISKEFLITFFSPFALKFLEFNSIKFEYWFLFALGSGTLAGFLLKFVLDKFIVFEEKLSDSLEKTSKQLLLYFSFAILTTIIFWGFELIFKILFTGNGYLLGGIIGLAIGYSIKFLLDRKYVFVSE